MVKNLIKQRIENLQSSLSADQAILLSKNSDVFYFSNFANSVPEERSAFLLIAKSSAHLLLQNFLPKPTAFVGEIISGCSLTKLSEHLNKLRDQLKLNELFLDFGDLKIEEFDLIAKIGNLKINKLDKKIIWQLRSQKDESEIKRIKVAKKITKQAILTTIKELKIGQSELAVKQSLESKIRQKPGCDLAFSSIVAFGKNTTLPHHQSGNKKLINGCVVLIDAGAKYQGYCADMTRTIFFKNNSKPSKNEAEFKKILQIVKQAQQKARKLLSITNVTVAQLDLACRDYITEKGYRNNFIHTTGHGLGIDIHEPPSIYKTNQAQLLPRMVITIEPGIYLEGKFGVRWEDTIFV